MTNIFLILLFPLFGLSTDSNMTEISTALQQGDAVRLGAYFDEQVELAVLNQEANCDATQATQLVERFFAENQPKTFNSLHHGQADDAGYYCIGNLTTSTNSFRVYIYLEHTASKSKIQELRFEE